MNIRGMFHKFGIGIVRHLQPSIPKLSDAKKYGNYGEEVFAKTILDMLPDAQIKNNVLISTDEGKAEIDCLILYENKLFAIELKTWKGTLFEEDGKILHEKIDRWTGETHSKIERSPFKQLNRAIYLLRKQNPINAWVNPIVFFASFEGDEELEVYVSDDKVWFNRVYDLVSYIKNQSKPSNAKYVKSFFSKCIAADQIISNSSKRTLNCIIIKDSLNFNNENNKADSIVSIDISHKWSYDKLSIKYKDGTSCTVNTENWKIEVDDNGILKKYALSKISRIEIG